MPKLHPILVEASFKRSTRPTKPQQPTCITNPGTLAINDAALNPPLG